MTALIRTPSLLMPSANAAGYTLGGNAWFQSKFKLSDRSTWTGIIIDPDGTYVGSDNIGITVWTGAVKKVQIKDGGISIYGGASVWVPDNYDPANQATWNGVAINSTGIFSYKAGLKTSQIDSEGMRFYNSSNVLKVQLSDAGITIYGGSSNWVPDNWNPSDSSTWTGVQISSYGVRSFTAGTKTSQIDSDGLSFYNGSTAVCTYK